MTARLVCAAQEVQGEEPLPAGAAGGGAAGISGRDTVGGGGIRTGGGDGIACGGGFDGSGGGEVGVAIGTGVGGGPALPQRVAQCTVSSLVMTNMVCASFCSITAMRSGSHSGRRLAVMSLLVALSSNPMPRGRSQCLKL